jgi:protein involved in sex pheromone biosynthesis
MKTIFLSSIVLFLFFLTGCESGLEQKINDLHASSREVEKEVLPKMEELVQQKNSLNVQGRALTEAEITFTGKVGELEQTLAQWQKGMEDAEKMKPGEDRLNIEKSLKEAILTFQKMVESLAPKPGF